MSQSPPAEEVGSSLLRRVGDGVVFIFALGVLVISLVAYSSHHILDLFSHFRAHLLFASLPCVLVGLVGRKGLAGFFGGQDVAGKLIFGVSLLALIVNGAEVGALLLSSNPRARPDKVAAKVLHANVLTSNRRFDKVIDLIEEESPEIVLLEEVDQGWVDAIESAFAEAYPHRYARPRSDNFGMMVLSRLPIENARFEAFGDPRFDSFIGEVPGGSVGFTFIGAHPPPPISKNYADARDAVLSALANEAAERSRVVLMGDLNATPFSSGFDLLTDGGGMRDSTRGFGLQPTWFTQLGWFGLPIDHCLLHGSVDAAERRVGPDIGSDHRPLIVTLRF